MDTQEGRACERSIEVRLQKLVERAETQRADVKPFTWSAYRPLEVWRLRTFADATGEQE